MKMLVAAKGDMLSGHEDWVPNKIATGSPNVNVQGNPVAREGDKSEQHVKTIPPPSPCVDTIVKVSKKVFVNGKGIARLMDETDKNSMIVTVAASSVRSG